MLARLSAFVCLIFFHPSFHKKGDDFPLSMTKPKSRRRTSRRRTSRRRASRNGRSSRNGRAHASPKLRAPSSYVGRYRSASTSTASMLGNDDIENLVKEHYFKFDVPSTLTTLADVDALREVLAKICKQQPVDKASTMKQLQAVSKALKLLEQPNGSTLAWVEAAIAAECREPFKFPPELMWIDTMYVEYGKHFKPYINIHGRARQDGESDEDWEAYKDSLGLTRAREVGHFFFFLNSEPRRLTRVRGFNRLCSFLKWVTDTLRKIGRAHV